MFHGGDSDSTGVIAACWFGATYGVQDVPDLNYKVNCFLFLLVDVTQSMFCFFMQIRKLSVRYLY